MEKTCRICKQSKPLDAFYGNPRLTGGHAHECKQCIIDGRKGKHPWIQMRYGISAAQYEAMISAQDGLCKICMRPTKRMCVDHCHKTMRIRGLLCNQCNCGLALFGENETLFLRAIEYLKPPADSSSIMFADPDRLRKRGKSKAFQERLRQGTQGVYHILHPKNITI